MKAKWMAGSLVAGLGLMLGLTPALTAQETQPGAEGSAYMQEDPDRMEQTGPGYAEEGTATGAAVEEGGVVGAAVGVQQPQQAGEPQAGAVTGAVAGAGEDEGTVNAAMAQPGSRSAAPGRNFVWVKPYRLPGGLWVQGFWRPRVMAGFTWVAGYWDRQNGFYVAGFWRPLRPKPGYVWVPGYWLDGRWYPGLWRAAGRNGFVWIPAHWSRSGEWIQAHWRPAGPAPRDQVWVPGHYDHSGRWMEGHWRMTAQSGAAWVPGHYNRHGEWVQGHWRATSPVPPRPVREQRRGRGPRR